MDDHLNGDQITALILGTEDEFVDRHLEACVACGNEVKEMRSAISAFRDLVHTNAQRDDSFWNRQNLAINERLTERRRYLPLQWIWVTAMSVVLVTAVIVARAPRATKNVATDESDKVLLQEVQGDLEVDVPEALAPAVLIADERNEILKNKVVRHTETSQKEGR
jgi:hypothetical protein